MRRFSRGPNTLFEYRPGMPLADVGGIFTGPANRSYVDVNGVLRYAALNEPRDNHWINGKRTFLREEGATNLVFRSEEFGDPAWSAFTGCSVIANTKVAPDAALTADKLQEDATNNNRTIVQLVTCPTGQYTFSIYLQAAERSIVVVRLSDNVTGQILATVDLAAGIITATTSSGSWTGASSKISQIGSGGWYRVSVTGTRGGAATACLCGIYLNSTGGYVGTLGAGVFLWGAQLEAGGRASSYIKTVTVVVARGADNLSFAWTSAPQVMTGLFSGFALSLPAASRLAQISGPNDLGPRYLVYMAGTGGSLYHQNANGGSALQVDTPNSIVADDFFEFRTVLRGDGSIIASKAINGVDVGSAGPSAALSPAGVWGTGGAPRLYVGSDGASAQGGNLAFTCIRFVKAEQSIEYMRYDFLNAISSDSAEFVHLLEFQFASGTVRLVTGAQDLSWNSFQWEAVGGLLEIGGVEETSDARAQGIDVRLSGVDQTVLAVLLGSQFRGRPVKIWRAHLDRTTGQLVGDPFLMFQGLQLSPYTVDEERSRTDGTVRISTRLSGYFGVERIRGIMTNLSSHQHYFSDVDAAKTSGVDGWTEQVYSVQGFFGGAFAQIEGGVQPSEVMFGLNDDPLTNASWETINFAMNLQGPGNTVTIYESGVLIAASVTTWLVGDIFTIIYDNNSVTYYKNGAVLRTVVVGPGLTFFFDSSFYGGVGTTYGIARLKNIRFGPDATLFRSTFIASSGVLITITPDLFFQHSASLANVKIYWGTPVPRTPGSNNGGGAGRTCFPAGTKVLLANGEERAIEEIGRGDWVASFEETDGSPRTGMVRGLLRHEADSLLSVTAGEYVLHVTPEHRIYVGAGKFVEAGQLCVGSLIWCRRADGSLGSEMVSRLVALPTRSVIVYNLEVEDHHTYFANGIAVHNIKVEPNDGL